MADDCLKSLEFILFLLLKRVYSFKLTNTHFCQLLSSLPLIYQCPSFMIFFDLYSPFHSHFYQLLPQILLNLIPEVLPPWDDLFVGLTHLDVGTLCWLNSQDFPHLYYLYVTVPNLKGSNDKMYQTDCLFPDNRCKSLWKIFALLINQNKKK